jgi:peptidoglycan/xylan/chitin deacetylase (PgdA/CDA1 family)
MPLKRAARAALARAAATLGGARAPRRVVLCWHSVHPTLPYASATPARFAEQLDWLAAHCDVVPFSRILAPRAADARPAVAITFDDGYADNHEHALPALAARGLTASFFLTAGLIARDEAVLARFRADRRGAPVEPLSWSQARELLAAGMEIGAHTWSHPNLAALPRARAAEELSRSKRALEDELGAEVPILAYPYGKLGRHVTSETIGLAAAAGYQLGAAVLFRGARADEPRLAVPRFFVNGEDSPASIAAKVAGDWDAIGWTQERLPRWAAKLLSPSDFAEAVRA